MNSSGDYAFGLPHNQGLIVGHDISSTHQWNSLSFPLSFANEWIWDPSLNQLSFTNAGAVYLRAGQHIRANTELHIGLGHGYCWDGYKRTLVQRCIHTLITIAQLELREDLVTELMQAQSSLSQFTIPELRHVPFLSLVLSHVLGLVEHYAEPIAHTQCSSLPHATIGMWCQQLSFHKHFANQHTFRKADKPSRPSYSALQLLTMDIAPPPPLEDLSRSARRTRNPSPRYSDVDLDTGDFVLELVNSTAPTMQRFLNHLYASATPHQNISAPSDDLASTPSASGTNLTTVCDPTSFVHPVTLSNIPVSDSPTLMHSIVSVESLSNATPASGVVPTLPLLSASVEQIDISVTSLAKSGQDIFRSPHLFVSVDTLNAPVTLLSTPAQESIPRINPPIASVEILNTSVTSPHRSVIEFTGTLLASADRLSPFTLLDTQDSSLSTQVSPAKTTQKEHLPNAPPTTSRYDSAEYYTQHCEDITQVLTDHFVGITSDEEILPTSHLKVVFQNINTLTDSKLTNILERIYSDNIDITVLIDTRVWKDADIRRLKLLVRTRLGPGSSAHFAKAQNYTHKGSGRSTSVGGQLVIKNSSIPTTLNFTPDPSQTGAVSACNVRFGTNDILILGVYCPVTHPDTEDTGTFHAKLLRYIHSTRNITDSPNDWIRQYISTLVNKHHRAQHTSTIVGGDWNAAWHETDKQGTNDSIQEWASPLSLKSPYSTLNITREPTHYVNDTPGTCIDHIIYRGYDIEPTGIRILHSQGWGPSDHRPLYATFRLANAQGNYIPRQHRILKATSPPIDIPRISKTNTPAQLKVIQDYQEYITERFQAKSITHKARQSQQVIRDITSLSVRAARKQQRKPKRKDGWSPEATALSIALSTLIELRRFIHGYARRRKWTTHADYKQGMHVLCSRWATQIDKLSHDPQQYDRLISLSGTNPSFWTDLSWPMVDPEVDRHIKLINKRLHGRNRQVMQDNMRTKNQRRKLARSERKHLRETKALLDKLKQRYELDEITDHQGNIITDGYEITRLATQHFKEWHAAKPALNFGFHDSHCDHARLLTDLNYFIASHIDTGVPTPLLTTIWTAMSLPHQQTQAPSAEFAKDLEHLMTRPTYAEFSDKLQGMPTQSAAGPSGQTYNMIASLPDTIKQHLYDHLSYLWDCKKGCPDWKWRILSPMPKIDGNITLNDLRPLTLIETTRKLWVGLIIDKIRHIWDKHELLHPSQHAYTAERGVDTVHPQHRNLLEEAREQCTSVFYSSWDVRRAFDRVPKPILRMSWERLGIPPDIAQYLVDFDQQGRTIVKTPYSMEVLRNQGLAGFCTQDATKCPCFVAEVGTGQGDVASPFSWIGFYDILLRSLSTVCTTPLLVRSEEHVLHPTEDSGYADDLISVSARIEGLQAKADIVSAFSIIFGLDIAVAKLRAVQIHWGSEDSAETPTHITIHTEQWSNSTLVPILSHDHPDAKPVKYLGVLFDFDNNNISQLRHTRELLQQRFSTLHTKSAPAQLKLEVVNCAILAEAKFAAKFTGWSLDTLLTIDKTFSKHYRKILGLLPGFPSELLYAPPKFAGIGLPRFSDVVNQEKLSIMHRALGSEDATRISMEGLLRRALRAGGQHPAPDVLAYATLPQIDKDTTLWADSLISWLHLADLALTLGGKTQLGTQHERIDHYISRTHAHPDPTDIDTLNAIGLRTVGDITTHSLSSNIAHFITKTDPLPQHSQLSILSALPAGITTTQIEAGQRRLAPQQCWLSPDGTAVNEIIGYTNFSLSTQSLHIRRWILHSDRLFHAQSSLRHGLRDRTDHIRRVNRPLILDPSTPSYGAGTPTVVSFTDLFPQGQIHSIRVILGIESTRPQQEGVQRLVIHSYPLPTPAPLPPPTKSILSTRGPPGLDLRQYYDLMRTSTIYTDGSHTSSVPRLDTYFRCPFQSPSPSTATASIIFQQPGCLTLQPTTIAIRIIQGDHIPDVNPFIMELLAITLATKLRHLALRGHTDTGQMDIHSDCKSAILLAQKSNRRPWRNRTHALLESIWRTQGNQRIHWVKAHPELVTTDSTKWTLHQHGNVLADKFASDNPPIRSTDHISTYTITTEDVLTYLLEEASWVITKRGQLLLSDVYEDVTHARWRQYVHDRDEFRFKESQDPKWVTRTLQNAGTWHNSKNHQWTERARISKLAYDWYWHGTKSAQSKDGYGAQPDVCIICGESDSQEHMLLGCSHPDLVHIRQDVRSNITKYINSLPLHSIDRLTAEAIRTMESTFNSDPHLLWIGTWNPVQTTYLCQTLQAHDSHHHTKGSSSTSHAQQLRALDDIGKYLADGARDLMSARHRIKTALVRARRDMYKRPINPNKARYQDSKTGKSTIHKPSFVPAPARDKSCAHLFRPTASMAQKAKLKLITSATSTPQITDFFTITPHTQPPMLNIPPSVIPHSQPAPKPNHPPQAKLHRRGYAQKKPLPVKRIVDYSFTTVGYDMYDDGLVNTPLTPPNRPHLPRPTITHTTTTLTPSPQQIMSNIGTRHTLTDQDEDTWTDLFLRSDISTILSTPHSTIQYTLNDMQRLTHEDSEHWISDTNIALVQSLLNEQSPPPLQAHSFTCIEPLRLTQLLTTGTYNYERVRRYFHTAQTNPLLYDTIYMTLNTTSTHWTTVIIDLINHRITYHDSLAPPFAPQHTTGHIELGIVRRLLHDIINTHSDINQGINLHLYPRATPSISTARLTSLGDPFTWTHVVNPTPHPVQTNNYDCGIFYLATIMYHMQQRLPTFSQQDISLIRRQLIAAIMTHSLPRLRPTTTNITPSLSQPVLHPYSQIRQYNDHADTHYAHGDQQNNRTLATHIETHIDTLDSNPDWVHTSLRMPPAYTPSSSSHIRTTPPHPYLALGEITTDTSYTVSHTHPATSVHTVTNCNDQSGTLPREGQG